MVKLQKISAVIITKNEEDNIERCIVSLKELVDEILIIDSQSTDSTSVIARSLGARVVQHQFLGHIEQKNFAINQATHDLILSLDADEALSTLLAQNLRNLLCSSAKVTAVRMSRLNFYLGKWIKHSGWYPDRKIRMFDRRFAYWGGRNPHDKVIVNDAESIVDVEGDILHYSYKNLKSHIQRIEEYSAISARQKFNARKSMNFVVHAVLYPVWVFLNTYFLKLGFLDGYQGFLISLLNAYYRFQKYFKLYKLYLNKLDR
ncbi:MAG: glycosyltransferase family 2 protein [Cyclobacteriaceae bacterium]